MADHAADTYAEEACEETSEGTSEGISEGTSEDDRDTACEEAALRGDLETLKALRKAGHEWDEDTCTNAAMSGDLEILQWLRAQEPPCPWDERSVCKFAAAAGNKNVLEWLYEMRVPYPQRGINYIDASCKDFLEKYGPSWRAGTYELLTQSQLRAVKGEQRKTTGIEE